MKSFFLPAFFLLLTLPSLTLAAGGENCEHDLTQGFPTGADWDSAYIIKDEGGSAWQRTLLTQSDDTIRLEEGSEFEIRGTAQPNMPIQIYLFDVAESEEGGILKPDSATCFDAGIANKDGYFSFPINARLLWGSIGDELVIDAYTRLDKNWEQLQTTPTDQSYLIGTHMPAKRFRIDVGSAAESCQKLCASSPYTVGARISPEKYPEMAQGTFGDFGNSGSTGGTITPSTQTNAVARRQITIAKLAPNTFYTLVNPEDSDLEQEIDGLVERALVAEIIKRHLIGINGSTGLPAGLNAPNVLPSDLHYLAEITEESLGRALAGKTVSPEIKALVQNLHDALTSPQGTQTRIRAINGIKNAFFAMMPDDRTGYSYPKSDAFDAVFPAGRQESQWRADLIDIFKLWTEELKPNRCLLPEANTQENFRTPPQNLLSAPIPDTNCVSEDQNTVNSTTVGMGNNRNRFFSARLSGKDPIIVVNGGIRSLTPDFASMVMTTSNHTFDENNSWKLNSIKSRFEYRYLPTVAFDRSLVSSTCVNRNQISDYAKSIVQQIGLPVEATELVELEINANAPPQSQTISIGLADPVEIAKRIRWKADGEHFDIPQLFFHIEAADCRPDAYPVIPKEIIQRMDTKDDRGFEIGII